MALTPAIRVPSGQVSGVRGSRRPASPPRSSGCGRLNPVVGRDDAGAHREHGLDQAGRARGRLGVADVGLDRAERGDVPRADVQLGEGRELGDVGGCGARAVPLDQLHVGGGDPGPLVGPVQGQQLALRVRHGDAHLARRRRAPAGDLGVHGQARLAGVGGPHQHDHAAAFAGQVPGGVLVVDAHVAAGQDPGLGQPDQLERVEADVHPARERDIEVAGGQRGARGRHRDQRRRLRAVHRVAATPEAEVAADPGRDAGGRGPGQGLVGGDGERGQVARGRVPQHRHRALPRDVARGERLGEHPPDVRPAQPQCSGAGRVSVEGVADDDPGAAAGQALAEREPCGRERAGRGLQREPVRRVGREEDRGRDPERRQVELPPLDHRSPGAVGRVGGGPVRAVVVGQVQPARRQPAERPALGQHQVEQRGRIVGVGETAGQADDGNRQAVGGVLKESVRPELRRTLTFRVIYSLVLVPGEFKFTFMLPMALKIPKWAQGLRARPNVHHSPELA